MKSAPVALLAWWRDQPVTVYWQLASLYTALFANVGLPQS